MSELSKKSCIPCMGGVPPLEPAEASKYLSQLSEWQIVANHHLEKQFVFRDFQSALDFVVQVGRIAEEEGHHPDIFLSWGKVKVEIWTHKIDGLTVSDFILAAKIDKI